MSDTTFANGTVITSDWLNYVNGIVYGFVDTIADLMALSKTRFTMARTKGYYSIGDGGAGEYYLDPLDTTSVHNGGTIIVASDGGRWKLTQKGNFSVAQFGAKGDGVTDDTAAFNNAISYLGTNGGVIRAIPGATHYIAQSNGILLPSNITLDLQGATLKGTGNSSSGNTLINSAYFNSGVLTINTLSNAVTGAKVCNGTLYNAAYSMQLRYCIDECSFENLEISGCFNGIYAQFCLYANFENIMARNTSTGTAYRFSNNCNAITIKNVYAVGTNPGTWAVGFQFDAKTYAVKLLNCSSEYCATGISTQEVHGFDIDGHYFEGITNLGIDLGTSAYRKIGVRIASCTFNSTPVLVYGRTVNDFVWEASNERASSCSPGSIDLQTDTSITDTALSLCTGVVRLSSQDLISKVPNSASIPAWLLLSNGMTIDATIGAAVTTSGIATPVFAKTTMAQIAPMAMMGYGGAAMNAGAQLQPFQTISYSGGTSFNVIIDTSISYADYGFAIFRFDIQDNVSTYKILGRVYGTDVFLDNAAGKTVTASNNGGKLRLTIGTFSHPSGAASVTSLVRHV